MVIEAFDKSLYATITKSKTTKRTRRCILKVIFKINHFCVGYMKGSKNGGIRRRNFKNHFSTLTQKNNPKS